MVIDKLKLLLSNINNTLTDEMLNGIVKMSVEHYLRFRPYTDPVNWGANERARSWITEYSLAYCKLTIAESPHPVSSDTMANAALSMLQTLETELQKYT